MQSFQDQYRDKCIAPEEGLSFVPEGGNLILAMGVAQPPGLIAGLAQALSSSSRPALPVYYMHGSQAFSEQLLVPSLVGKIIPRPLFLSKHDRDGSHHFADPHTLEFVPAAFHQVGRLLTEQISPDCFMTTVSPMDRHGYFSLGTNPDYGASVVRKASKVVVEVNPQMPRTFGECSVHISEVHGIIENDQPLAEVPMHAPNATDLTIASHILEHINDGDTLQMGVGGVPNAVLSQLYEHNDLGLHSELFSPAMVDLIKRGVINGRRKYWMQHRHVFTLALGNRELYDFLDDNPSVLGYPASWVNNPVIIAKNPNMVSVNAALEVDLTGQINAEQIDGAPFSGTGGQLDFVRGAYASRGGRSFIALHATAKNNTLSKIVPQLRGGVVTDTRMDTQYVVTEFGCVNVKGLSLPARARALIGIAHPDFRAELEDQAKTLGLM